MRNKKIKSLLSFIITICLLLAVIPMIQVEDTLALENNITASINGCEKQSSANLLEVIKKTLSHNATINSIVISEGVVTEDDFKVIKEKINSLKKLSITSEVKNVAEVPKGLFSATAENLNTTLKTVDLAHVNNVPANLFAFCTALENASLPNAISIGDNAFGGCISLKSLTLGAVVPKVSNNTFDACGVDRVLYVPSTSIQAYLNTNNTVKNDMLDVKVKTATSLNNDTWNGFKVLDVSKKIITEEKEIKSEPINETTPTNKNEPPLKQAAISIKAPVAGAKIEQFVAESYDGLTEIVYSKWSDGSNTLSTGKFAANTVYTAEIIITPKYAETFTTDSVAKINGETVKGTLNEDKTQMSVKKSFKKTGPAVEGINVHVRDKDTDKPVKDAQVFFEDVNVTVKTDVEGFITVSDFTPGEYKIVVNANGYMPEERTVTYQNGVLVVNVALTLNNITGVDITPKTAEVEKGKEKQFQAIVKTPTGISVSGVYWSLEGEHHTDTTINEKTGLLKTSYDEKEKSVTVVATAKADGMTTGKVKVTLKDVPPSKQLSSPALIPVQIPVTGEKVNSEISTKEFNGIVTWTPEIVEDSFAPLKKYTAKVIVKANRGFRFAKDTLVTVTDSNKIYDIRVDKDAAENTLSFKVTFPSTFHPDYETQKPLAFSKNVPRVKKYGDTDFVIYASGGTGDGEITYKSTNEKVLKVESDKDAATVKVMSVGTAKIIATKAGDIIDSVSYNPISVTTDDIVVTPRMLTATAKDVTIKEGSTPKFEVTVSGFVNNDTEETLKLKGYQKPVAECSDTAIGNYAIKVSAGKPTDNYEFDYIEGKLKIVSKDTDLSENKTPDILVSKDVKDEVSIEKLEGSMFKEGTKLSVKDITKSLDERDKRVYDKNVALASKGKELALLYDIKLINDGKDISPDGKVKVTLTIPQEVKDNYKDLQIVYIDKYGKVEILNSELNYSKISFNTDHFSMYGIIGTPRNISINPQTGDKAFNMIFVVLGLISFAILVFIPKKIKK